MAAILLLASAARYGGGRGAVLDAGSYAVARLALTVTSVAPPAGVDVQNHHIDQPPSNPPKLEVVVETSPDSDPNASSWRSLHTFPSMTEAGAELKTLGGFDRYLRARWVSRSFTPVIEGTPQDATFTFSLEGDAV